MSALRLIPAYGPVIAGPRRWEDAEVSPPPIQEELIMSGHRCGKWNNSGFLLPASLGGDVLKSDVSQKVLPFAKGKNEAACTDRLRLRTERNLHLQRGGEAGVCAESPAHWMPETRQSSEVLEENVKNKWVFK